MDIKKPDYQIAYEERQKQLGKSLETEHPGPIRQTRPEALRDEQTEIKTGKDSQQLGEGARE